MTEEKKAVKSSKPTPAQALKLLQDAADALNGIPGKDAAIWQAIAVNVEKSIAAVEKYK